MAIPLFVSYSHEDIKLADRVERQLASLRNQGLIDIWIDKKLRAGDSLGWEEILLGKLRKADVLVVLLSANFANSPYCQKELDLILERKKNGDLVYLVYLRTYPMERRLSMYEFRPKGRAIESFETEAKQDEALAMIAEEIRIDIEGLALKKGASKGTEFGDLPYLFDRTNQRLSLIALCDKSVGRRERPCVFMLSAPEREVPAGFHQAMARDLLPVLWNRNQPVQQIPYGLPNKASRFGMELRPWFQAESSHPEDLRNAFPQGLTYLSTRISDTEWNKALTGEFLRYWDAFPDLAPGSSVCVGISIESSRVSGKMLGRHFPSSEYPGMHFDVLEDLKPPKYSPSDVDKWTRHCGSPERARRLAKAVKDVFTTYGPEIPMEQLAEYLQKELERLP